MIFDVKVEDAQLGIAGGGDDDDAEFSPEVSSTDAQSPKKMSPSIFQSGPQSSPDIRLKIIQARLSVE